MEPENKNSNPAQSEEQQNEDIRNKQQEHLLKSRTDKEIEEADKRGESPAETNG